MKEKLITGLEETSKDLLATLSYFTQEEFNRVPFEGSWTAGQVAEHLFKSESNIPRVLNGNWEETERDPFEKVAAIESIFLDYTIKLQSPEFILPSDEAKDKEYFIKGFEGTRKELKRLITNSDLSRTFTDFPFPQLGRFTGWEWICFAVCHSKRHIRQMKLIAERLKTSKMNTVK
jgi:DinB superfamily